LIVQRRSFLSGILAAASAPAIVKANSLMPIWTPKWHRGGVVTSDVVCIDRWWAGKTAHLEVARNEVFDEFTLAQVRLIASSMGLPFGEMIKPMPETQVVYSSARVVLLEQLSKTPLSRPLNVRSNHGQFPS
jgi:hypothetical protein